VGHPNVDLPIIQKTYDLIVWFVPRINKMPRDFKFTLGDRLQANLYGILENLITARWRREKIEILHAANARLDLIRYQTRLCREFKLLDDRRFEHVSLLINEVGKTLGGWIRERAAKSS